MRWSMTVRVSLLCLASCARSDLELPCEVIGADGGVVSWRRLPAGAVVSRGAVECEHEVCLVNPATPRPTSETPAAGYCSRPCTTDEDCVGGAVTAERGVCGASDPGAAGAEDRHCWYPNAGAP